MKMYQKLLFIVDFTKIYYLLFKKKNFDFKTIHI